MASNHEDIQTKLNAVLGRLDGMHGRLDGVEGRLGQLEDKVKSVQDGQAHTHVTVGSKVVS